MYCVGQTIRYHPVWDIYDCEMATIVDIRTGLYGQKKYTVRLSDGYKDEIYESQIIGIYYTEYTWF